MTINQAIRFIEQHGIVLEAGQGPAPTLARQVLGPSVRGSWWSHPKAKEFFRLTRAVRENPAILVCRLVNGKITYVHKRLWPALARQVHDLGAARLTALREVHTDSGAHKLEETPFRSWVPADVVAAARDLTRQDAIRELSRYPALAGIITASASPRTPRAGRADR
jgi:hypothetical protein